jgi:hypothetical protein
MITVRGSRPQVRSRRSGRGVSSVETLLALPILLFVGLGAIQLALVYRAQHALTFALTEAARAGSLSHADPGAVREGLARGLLPWMLGADSIDDYVLNLARARVHVAGAEAAGWLRLEQQSPTAASFQDWAEPALDAGGEPIPGLREIPNDNLVHRAVRMRPASGIAGSRGGEPVGSLSRQTLADANLLRLRLEYGVPLAVPVVGRLIAATLRAWNGCETGSATRIGLIALPAPGALPHPEPRACAFYGGVHTERARLPVSVSATVRMQSPARETDALRPAAGGGVGDDPGSASDRRVPPPDASPPLPAVQVITAALGMPRPAVTDRPGLPSPSVSADPAVCTASGK